MRGTWYSCGEILGHPWLVEFNLITHWQTGVMRFPSPRLVQDYNSVNGSIGIAAPKVSAIEVTSDILSASTARKLVIVA